jgi:hypothetical protein
LEIYQQPIEQIDQRPRGQSGVIKCRHRPVWVNGMVTVLIVEDEFAIADLLEIALH